MRVLTLSLLLALTACASLQWQPDDSVGIRAVKTGARVVLGVPTFGISEIAIHQNAEFLAQERASERKSAFFRELLDELERYREMAETAKTPEERDTALRLADGVLNQMQIMFSERETAEPETCIMVPVGRMLVQRCM